MKSLLSVLALAFGALTFQSCEVYPNATSRGYYGGGYYGGGGYYDGGYYGGGGYYDGGYYGGGGYYDGGYYGGDGYYDRGYYGGGPYGPTVVVSSGDREHHHGYGYSNDYYDRANNRVNRNDHVNRNASVNRNAQVNRNAHAQSERKRSSSASDQNRQ